MALVSARSSGMTSVIRSIAGIVAFAVIDAAALAAQNPAPLAADSVRRALADYAQRAEALGVSGVLLVAAGDDVLLHRALGWRDPARRVPNDTTTLFYIASMVKQFIATAVLVLEDEGRLRTSDTLPSFFENVSAGQARDHAGPAALAYLRPRALRLGPGAARLARPGSRSGGARHPAEPAGAPARLAVRLSERELPLAGSDRRAREWTHVGVLRSAALSTALRDAGHSCRLGPTIAPRENRVEHWRRKRDVHDGRPPRELAPARTRCGDDRVGPLPMDPRDRQGRRSLACVAYESCSRFTLPSAPTTGTVSVGSCAPTRLVRLASCSTVATTARTTVRCASIRRRDGS